MAHSSTECWGGSCSGQPQLSQIKAFPEKASHAIFVMMPDDLVCDLNEQGVGVCGGVGLRSALKHAEIVIAVTKSNDMLYRKF